jgi:hypothetical protein
MCLLLIAPLSAISQTSTGTQQTAETPFSSDPQLQLKNTIELFPNPVEDYLQIKILNSELQDVKFEMHSIIGNAVQIETEEVGKDSYRIPVESFTNGYYFLVVKDDITRFSKAFKFLKKD